MAYLISPQRRRGGVTKIVLGGLRPTRRGGLGQIMEPMGFVTDVAAPSDAANCWWEYLFGKSAYDSCVNTAGVIAIQSVPVNAAAAGYSPSVVAIAQAAADQQSGMVSSDTSALDSFYNLPSNPLIPSLGPTVNPGDPSTWPLWVWIAIAGVGALVLWKS